MRSNYSVESNGRVPFQPAWRPGERRTLFAILPLLGRLGCAAWLTLPCLAAAQSLSEALDQDATGWFTTGAATWIGQTAYTHDGIDAAESGLVYGRQSSILQTVVTGPVGVGFWWSAPLRSAYDFLSFNIGSTQMAILRGERGWYRRGFNIPAGEHLLTWHYYKDSFFHDGLDRGYVDEVVFSQPPLIFDQPVSHSAQPGESTTFSVFAIGAETITYQWFFNGASLPDATNALLLLTNVQAAQAGNYSVVLSNAFDAVTSATASLAVIAFPDALETTNLVWASRGDALWTTQNAVTHDGVDAAESGTLPFVPFVELSSILEAKTPSAGIVSFWVKASSSYPFLFRLGAEERFRLGGEVDWTYFSFPVPDRSPLEWLLLSDGFFPVGESRAWLDEVTFTPVFAPRLHQQPAGGTFPAESPVQLSIGAIGAEPLGYHWFLNNVPFPTDGTNALLAFPHVQTNQAGSYFVVVSNAYGMATSEVAVISVYGLGGALDTTGLVWSTNGDAGWFSQTLVTHDGVDAAASEPITHNQSAVLETIVTGPGTLTFWWKASSEKDFDRLTFYASWLDYDGRERPFLDISGETGWEQRSFLVPPGGQVARWRYEKDATETAGLDRGWLDEVTFTPLAAPVVIDPPQSQIVPTGGDATLYVTAYGAEPLVYQWEFNGEPLADATNSTLALAAVGEAQEGEYRVVVSNEFGTATSVAVRLDVISLGEAVDNTSLVWNNTGFYPWRVNTGTTHDGVDAVVSGPLEGVGWILETTVTGPGVVAFWWKVASFWDGECCEAFAFNIGTNTPAQIAGAVDWEYRVFHVPAGTQTLSWIYFDTGEGIPWNDDRAWVDEISFVADDAIPTVSSPSRSRIVWAGSDVSLNAGVVGALPLDHQWLFNQTTPVPDATNATLFLPNVQLAQAGQYHAVVVNAFGSVTTSPTRLTVIEPQLHGYFDAPGDGIDLDVSGTLACVADGEAGVRFFDVSDPTNAVAVGSYPTHGYTYGVRVSGSLAYVADGEAGVQILNVSDPASPALAGSYNTKGDARAVRLAGSRLFVADGWAGLTVLDVSNPANPTRLGGHRPPGDLVQVQLAGSLACVASLGSGVHLLDVSNPAAIVPLGFYPAYYARDLQVIGSRLYFTEGDPDHEKIRVDLLDISDPTRIVRLGGAFIAGRGGEARLRVVGELAFVTEQDNGLELFDFSVPDRVLSAGTILRYPTWGGLEIVGRRVYLAGREHDLTILDLNGLPAAAPFLSGARVSGSTFEATIENLYGVSIVVLESSLDLAHWQPFLTNAVATPTLSLSVPLAGSSPRFFRAVGKE